MATMEHKELLTERGGVRSTSRSMHDISSAHGIATRCGWVCDHSCATLNCLRFVVVLGVSVLPLVVLYAEDLTTLDGKTFTNITEVAKYPNQVFFTCNEKRTSVAISNLPTEFRVKYGLKEQVKKSVPQMVVYPTNSVFESTIQLTNGIDIFLSQNTNSDLEVEREIKEEIENNDAFVESGKWKLRLAPPHFQLKAETSTLYWKTDDRRSDGPREIAFNLGQEALIESIFNKFIEWEQIASTNKAEPFEKEISRWPGGIIYRVDGMRRFTFYWWPPAYLSDSDSIEGFYVADVVRFRQLLKLVPELKEELAQKIRKKEAQKKLFR